MVPIEPRGVTCEIFVESGAEWVDPEAVAVDEIYGPVLRNSPRFARRVDGEALQKILANAEKGVWRVSCGLADAFILCPLATEDIFWDARNRELRVRLCASVWIFVSRRAFGDVAPICFRDLCLLYYERVVGPLVAAFILRACGGADASAEDVRWRACEGLREAFSEASPRLPPFEPYQERLQAALASGRNPDEAFLDVSRDLLSEGRRALRALALAAI
ncbi:MAG TPA: hypothetical protein VF950_26095 [Planctomycetota bacterium]